MEMWNQLLLALDQLNDTSQATRKNELQEVIRQIKNVAVAVAERNLDSLADAIVNGNESAEDLAVSLNDKTLDALDDIKAELAKPAEKQDLKPLFKSIVDGFDAHEQGTAKEIASLRKCIEKLDLKVDAPVVNIDTDGLLKSSEDVVAAVKAIKIPETPKTDLSPVVAGLTKIYERPIPVPQFPSVMGVVPATGFDPGANLTTVINGDVITITDGTKTQTITVNGDTITEVWS